MNREAAPDPELDALKQEAERLRQAGQVRDAVELVARKAAGRQEARWMRLRRTYSAVWWASLEARRLRLRRRGPTDHDFIRRCWADASFMARFNRYAGRLPASDDELRRILAREYLGLPLRDRSLHWTVETLAGVPFGILSLVGIDLVQRRAEILIGIRDQPYAGCAGEAMYRALEFAFAEIGIEKIEAMLYRENVEALRNIQHLGFVHEGVRRQHLRGAPGAGRQDVVMAGFTRADFDAERTARLFRRLLGRAAKLPPGDRP